MAKYQHICASLDFWPNVNFSCPKPNKIQQACLLSKLIRLNYYCIIVVHFARVNAVFAKKQIFVVVAIYFVFFSLAYLISWQFHLKSACFMFIVWAYSGSQCLTTFHFHKFECSLKKRYTQHTQTFHSTHWFFIESVIYVSSFQKITSYSLFWKPLHRSQEKWILLEANTHIQKKLLCSVVPYVYTCAPSSLSFSPLFVFFFHVYN